MARGLGAIMAEVQAAADRHALANGEVVACPLCGQVMDFNGAAWSCRSGSRRSDGTFDPCDLEEIMKAFLEPEEGRYIDDWQGAILAAVVVDNEVLVVFGTVRGAYGRTNLTVSANWKFEGDKSEIPHLIQKYGWTWMEWVPPKFKQKQR